MYVFQLDLSRAFDRVKHSSILAALKLQSASLQCLALLSMMLHMSSMAYRLGTVESGMHNMERGLPQGAPESPLLFVLVTELVLRPLLLKWRTAGRAWCIDSFWLASICFADDILLVSTSLPDLESMAAEVTEAFLKVGLEVGPVKCHWSSFPSKSGLSFRLGNAALPWEQTITFVGTVIDLAGGDAAALDHRIAQATKVWGKWRNVLYCRHVAPIRRARLIYNSVFSSVLWLSECWNPTQAMLRRLDSWGARTLALAYGLRKSVAEDALGFWRRLHWFGHYLYY